MADDTTLPAQATGNTLPGQAADLADIAPAPSAADALLQANYGDTGAQQYKNLQAAGQQAPTPAAPSGTAPVGPSLTNLVGGADLPTVSPLAKMLTAYGAKDPMAGNRAEAMLQQQFLGRATAAQEFQQRAQTMVINDATFVEKLQNEPPDVRAMMIQAYAAKQGRVLTPAESKYIADIDPEHLEHTKMLAEQGDVTALGTLKALFGGNPTDMVTAKADIIKRSADASKAISDAQKAAAEEPFAGPQASANLEGKRLENQFKKLDVDTFYDSVARQVQAEATSLGKKPGTPDFTNYISQRTAQLETYAKRQAFMNTPLQGRNAEDFNQADRAGKFATQALQLLNDPTIANNRGVLEGRLRNLAWRLGFAQSENEDLYQSISNISGLMGSKVYSGGIRNMKWIDRVMEHTLKAGDEPGLLKDKVTVLLRAAHEQQQGIINTATTPIGKLQPTVTDTSGTGTPPTAPGAPAPTSAAPAPDGAISAADFLNQ